LQVDSIKTRVESAYGQRLNIQYDETLPNDASNVNLRRYNVGAASSLTTKTGLNRSLKSLQWWGGTG
jgi:hypothetical protein